jgi:hypothetical protein
VKQDKVEEAHLYLEHISEMKSTKVGEAASYYMDAIDNKTSSLLSHVSIMMAILSIFYATITEHSLIRSALLVELFFYLIVTLGCLRSIFIFGPGGKQSTVDDIIQLRVNEVISRLRAYRWSLSVTIVTTLAFIATMAIHFPHVM